MLFRSLILLRRQDDIAPLILLCTLAGDLPNSLASAQGCNRLRGSHSSQATCISARLSYARPHLLLLGLVQAHYPYMISRPELLLRPGSNHPQEHTAPQWCGQDVDREASCLRRSKTSPSLTSTTFKRYVPHQTLTRRCAIQTPPPHPGSACAEDCASRKANCTRRRPRWKVLCRGDSSRSDFLVGGAYTP